MTGQVASVTAPADNPAAARVLRGPGAWRRLLAVFLVLLTVGGAVNLAVIQRGSLLAPADGHVYADAFFRATAGQVTLRGDTLGPETLDILFCRDTRSFYDQFRVGAGRPERVPEVCVPEPVSVGTSAWVHPPTYFFVQAGLARAIQVFSPGSDALTAARLGAALWFALGGLALVVLACLWGARVWPATAVVAALAPTPLFVALHAYVTPDNLVLLVSAAVLVAVTLWARGRLAAPWLALAGVLSAGLVKQTFVVAAMTGLLLIAFLVRQVGAGGSRPTARQGVVAGAWLASGAAVSGLIWEVVKRTFGTSPTAVASDPLVSPLRFDSLFSTAFGGIPGLPLGDSQAITMEPIAARSLAAVLLIALAGAAVGALMYPRTTAAIRPIALAGVVGVAVGATFLALLSLPTTGVLLPAAPRYVMGAFPAYAVPLLVVARQRSIWLGAVLLTVLGVVSWAAWPMWPLTG